MRKKIVTLTSKFWGIPVSKIVDGLAFDNQNILGGTNSVRFFQFIAAIDLLNPAANFISRMPSAVAAAYIANAGSRLSTRNPISLRVVPLMR